MVKHKSLLSIFITFFYLSFAHANWESIDCETTAKEYMKTVFENDSFEVLSGLYQNKCAFKISSKLEAMDSVNYGFYPTGRITISTNFASQVETKKYSQQVSSKTYYLDSASPSNVQLFYDTKTKNLKVITSTGKELIFNSRTRQIDEEQTVDFKVSQKPLTPYTDIIQIKPKDGFMSTFKVRFGNSNTVYPTVNTLVETEKNSCNVQSYKLNLFKYKCRTGNCDCVRQEGPYCLISYSQMQNLNLQPYRDIDGSAPIHLDKRKQKLLISSFCPDLFNSQDELKPKKNTYRVVQKPASTVRAKTIKNPVQKNKKVDSPVKDTVVAGTLTGQLLSHCQSLLQKYFGSEKNKSLVNQYIKDQSKITLHRLAWNILKLNDKPTVDFDETIKKLLINRNPELHKEFINKTYPTRNKFLLDSMSDLKNEVSQKTSSSDLPYTLKYSDTKMLHLLLEAEKQHGRSAKSGVMDFLSIIRNSLKGRDKSKNLSYTQSIVDQILINKNTFEINLNKYLKDNDCQLSKSYLECNIGEVSDISISELLASNKNIIDKIYEKKFERTQELKENFKWNTYWLHVK